MSDMFDDFGLDEFDDSVVEIAGCMVLNREKAILWATGEEEVWIPKSQITDQNLDENRAGTIFVKNWFAEKEGLV